MCLIALMPPGKRLEEWEIRSAFSRNDDGFGIMMPLGDGTIKVQKIVPKTVDPVIELYNKFANTEAAKVMHHAVHFRFKTHGATDLANAHPFRVLRKEKHGVDLYMMHNGVITHSSMPKSEPNKSDTWHFIHHILRPVLKHDPNMIYDPKFQRMLEMTIGFGSKLTFMDHNGTPILINKTQGHERADGVWLSNTGAIVRPNSYERWNGAEYSRHWSERLSNSRRATNTSITNPPPSVPADKKEDKPIPFDPSNSVLLGTLGATGSECMIPDPVEGKYYTAKGEWDDVAWKRDCDSFFLAFEAGALRSPSGDKSSDTTDNSAAPTGGDATAGNLDSGSKAPATEQECTTCDIQSENGEVRGAVTCKENPGTPIADCERDCDCSSVIEKSKSMSVMANGNNGGGQLATLPFSGDSISKTHLSQFLSKNNPLEAPVITTELLCELDRDDIIDLTMSFPEEMTDYVIQVLHFFDKLAGARSQSRANIHG